MKIIDGSGTATGSRSPTMGTWPPSSARPRPARWTAFGRRGSPEKAARTTGPAPLPRRPLAQTPQGLVPDASRTTPRPAPPLSAAAAGAEPASHLDDVMRPSRPMKSAGFRVTRACPPPARRQRSGGPQAACEACALPARQPRTPDRGPGRLGPERDGVERGLSALQPVLASRPFVHIAGSAGPCGQLGHGDAETASWSGSCSACSRSRSMTTEVSSRPTSGRSGTRLGTLIDHGVDVITEAVAVDRRRTAEDLGDGDGVHEAAAA